MAGAVTVLPPSDIGAVTEVGAPIDPSAQAIGKVLTSELSATAGLLGRSGAVHAEFSTDFRTQHSSKKREAISGGAAGADSVAGGGPTSSVSGASDDMFTVLENALKVAKHLTANEKTAIGKELLILRNMSAETRKLHATDGADSPATFGLDLGITEKLYEEMGKILKYDVNKKSQTLKAAKYFYEADYDRMLSVMRDTPSVCEFFKGIGTTEKPQTLSEMIQAIYKSNIPFETKAFVVQMAFNFIYQPHFESLMEKYNTTLPGFDATLQKQLVEMMRSARAHLREIPSIQHDVTAT